MTEFALYLDDGGTSRRPAFLVVAGNIATESQSLAFESK